MGSRRKYRDEDKSLDIYLGEIGETPLLKLEEEVALAVRIHDGDQQALHHLIKANLRFVVSVAKQYQNQGLPLADLINEGNTGLIKAAGRFDETRGFKFITYAVWWIRQAILAALAEYSRIVRLPLNRVGHINKVSKITSSLAQDLGRQPSPEEIAAELELPEEEVTEALQISKTHLSLDAPFDNTEDNSLIDVLADELEPAPDEAMLQHSLRLEIEKALMTLTPREAEVINLYFGLTHEKAITLEEIGARFALTRERIRQIKENAVRRLRHASRSRSLRKFFDGGDTADTADTDVHDRHSSTKPALPSGGIQINLDGPQQANLELIEEDERRSTELSPELERQRKKLVDEVKQKIKHSMPRGMIRLYYGLEPGIKPLSPVKRVGDLYNGTAADYYVKRKLDDTAKLRGLRKRLEKFRRKVRAFDKKALES